MVPNTNINGDVRSADAGMAQAERALDAVNREYPLIRGGALTIARARQLYAKLFHLSKDRLLPQLRIHNMTEKAWEELRDIVLRMECKDPAAETVAEGALPNTPSPSPDDPHGETNQTHEGTTQHDDAPVATSDPSVADSDPAATEAIPESEEERVLAWLEHNDRGTAQDIANAMEWDSNFTLSVLLIIGDSIKCIRDGTSIVFSNKKVTKHKTVKTRADVGIENKKIILEWLATCAGTVKEISEGTHLDQSTTFRHLQNLITNGKIARKHLDQGPYVYWRTDVEQTTIHHLLTPNTVDTSTTNKIGTRNAAPTTANNTDDQERTTLLQKIYSTCEMSDYSPAQLAQLLQSTKEILRSLFDQLEGENAAKRYYYTNDKVYSKSTDDERPRHVHTRVDDHYLNYASTAVNPSQPTTVIVVDEYFERLKQATPDAAKEIIVSALTTIRSLQGNTDGLRAFYTKFETKHPMIPRSTLIQWAIRTPEEQAWLTQQTVIVVEEEAEAERRSPSQTNAADITATVIMKPALKKPRHKKSSLLKLKTYISPFHMRSHRQDPTLSTTIKPIIERLTDDEWEEYEVFLHDTKTLEQAQDRFPRFVELFQKAFATSPDDADAICRVFLTDYAQDKDGFGVDRDMLSHDENDILDQALRLVRQICRY